MKKYKSVFKEGKTSMLIRFPSKDKKSKFQVDHILEQFNVTPDIAEVGGNFLYEVEVESGVAQDLRDANWRSNIKIER